MRRAAVVLAVLVTVALTSATAQPDTSGTATPIQHLVVIFQENVSFDHYFGTYPRATNPAGEPRFVAASGTPSVDGLTPSLLTHNPNLDNPFRFDRADLFPCDQLHDYSLEQKAFDDGAMDRFVEFTASPDPRCDRSQVMGYYDGNTVTALWNYAQHYAMSDRFFGSTFGPSTVGALNLVAGQTHGASPAAVPDEVSNGTVIGDPEPAFDSCSSQPQVSVTGKNVGDLLNAKRITWGWFEGGFRNCGASHTNLNGGGEKDYVPHHEPFQYFAQSSNPQHLPPSSPALIGQTDQANHQYDTADFWTAVDSGRLPAVSFLKAPAYQDGHPGNSDPLDEQTFLVQTIDRLEQSSYWRSTAIVIAYDDSDGWYDHAFAGVRQASADPLYDGLTGPGACGSPSPGSHQDRCGLGPRLPLLVISPYAKPNYVSHVQLEQASILRFVEENWGLGRIGDQSFDARATAFTDLFDFRKRSSGRLLLDPATGEPTG